jgi:hypothetical protein
MRFYWKAVKAYFQQVFFPDDRPKVVNRHGSEPAATEYLLFKRTVLQRYKFYTVDDLMIVNPATNRYEVYPMPKPFSIPGKIYWWLVYRWELYQDSKL